MNLFEEATQWAVRAERHRGQADRRHGHCRRTMQRMADEEEHLAQRAVTHALAFDAARRRGCIEDDDMQSKSGLHPYDDGLQCILRETSKLGPKSRAAIVASDVTVVSARQTVRMLAHMFNKTDRQVARDVIDLFHALENGSIAR